MNKQELRALCTQLVGLHPSGTQEFFRLLDERLLSQRISFPFLEFTGSAFYSQLGAKPALAIAEKLVAHNAMGGYVIAANILENHLTANREMAWKLCVDYLIRGNEWYTCDILAERVFGQSLLQEFEATVAFLETCQQHNNHWVKRSVGIAVHLAAKRPITPAQADRLMQLCMKQAHIKSLHVKKGCGWGIETIAKFFPEVAENYRAALLDDPAICAWNRRKLLMGFEKAQKRLQKAKKP